MAFSYDDWKKKNNAKRKNTSTGVPSFEEFKASRTPTQSETKTSGRIPSLETFRFDEQTKSEKAKKADADRFARGHKSEVPKSEKAKQADADRFAGNYLNQEAKRVERVRQTDADRFAKKYTTEQARLNHQALQKEHKISKPTDVPKLGNVSKPEPDKKSNKQSIFAQLLGEINNEDSFLNKGKVPINPMGNTQHNLGGQAEIDSNLGTARAFFDPNNVNDTYAEKTGANLRLGAGDIIETVGSSIRWVTDKRNGKLNKENHLADSFQKVADKTREGFEDSAFQGEFEYSDWNNPEWLATQLPRTAPQSLISLIPALGTAKILGSVNKIKKLPKVWKTVVQAVGGGAADATIDSTLEAGSVYDEALRRGMSHEEADERANETFEKNFLLNTGTSIPQFLLALTPAGRVMNKLPKPAQIALRGTGGAILEGFQEGAQTGITASALDDDFAWTDPSTVEAILLGSLLGGGTTTAMATYQEIKGPIKDALTKQPNMDAPLNEILSRAIDRMPPEIRREVEQSAANFREQQEGLSHEDSIELAAEGLMNADSSFGEVIQQVTREYVEDKKLEMEANSLNPVTQEQKNLEKAQQEQTLEEAQQEQVTKPSPIEPMIDNTPSINPLDGQIPTQPNDLTKEQEEQLMAVEKFMSEEAQNGTQEIPKEQPGTNIPEKETSLKKPLEFQIGDTVNLEGTRPNSQYVVEEVDEESVRVLTPNKVSIKVPKSKIVNVLNREAEENAIPFEGEEFESSSIEELPPGEMVGNTQLPPNFRKDVKEILNEFVNDEGMTIDEAVNTVKTDEYYADNVEWLSLIDEEATKHFGYQAKQKTKDQETVIPKSESQKKAKPEEANWKPGDTVYLRGNLKGTIRSIEGGRATVVTRPEKYEITKQANGKDKKTVIPEGKVITPISNLMKEPQPEEIHLPDVKPGDIVRDKRAGYSKETKKVLEVLNDKFVSLENGEHPPLKYSKHLLEMAPPDKTEKKENTEEITHDYKVGQKVERREKRSNGWGWMEDKILEVDGDTITFKHIIVPTTLVRKLESPKATEPKVNKEEEVSTKEKDIKKFYGITLARRSQTGKSTMPEDRPQGLYMSMVKEKDGYISPFEEVGSETLFATFEPKNPLIAVEMEAEHKRFGNRRSGEVSSGISALHQLVGEEKFLELMKLSKADVLELLETEYPGSDYKRYSDAYELLEAYSGQLGRDQGYDSFILEDSSMAEYSEVAVLKNDAIKYDEQPKKKETKDSDNTIKQEEPKQVTKKIEDAMEFLEDAVNQMKSMEFVSEDDKAMYFKGEYGYDNVTKEDVKIQKSDGLVFTRTIGEKEWINSFVEYPPFQKGKEKKTKKETPKEKLSAKEEILSYRKKIRERNYTAQEVKDHFQFIKNNEEEVKAYFMDLMNNSDKHKRKRKDTKEKYVNDLYKEALERPAYADDDMLTTRSYDIFASPEVQEASRLKQLEDKINSITDESIKKYLDKRQSERDEKQRMVDNPETVRDFIYKRENGGLSVEEQAKLDELQALNQREKQAEKKAPSKDVISKGDFTIEKTKHTKTGEDLWVAKYKGGRIPTDEFNELRKSMKAIGGSWSNFTKGFNFKSDPTDKLDGDISEEVALSEGGRDATRIAERLRKTADNMQKTIDEKRNDNRKTNTHKRATEDAHAREEADRLERQQRIMNRIADAIESGEATFLDNVTARTHIETLDSVVNSIRRKRLEGDTKLNPSEREKLANQPITEEEINAIKMPKIEVSTYHLDKVLKANVGTKGLGRVAQRLNKAIRDVGGVKEFGGKEVNGEVYREEVLRLANSAIKNDKEKYFAEYLKGKFDTPKRLEAMNLNSVPLLRSGIREYIKYVDDIGENTEQNKKDAKRKKEAELSKLNIAGFFPTPNEIIDSMLERAEIEPGMKVLEPSAGKGNIAERIRDEHEGVRLDVVEYNFTLHDYLKSQDFNVVGGDFLEFKGFSYDRILMNPPFEKGQDIDHVKHAYDLLKPGGRVVAIMSEGPFFRGDKKATSFREWLDELSGVSDRLQDGAFKVSERSTGVATRIVTIDKPIGVTEQPTGYNQEEIAASIKKKFKFNAKKFPHDIANEGVGEFNGQWTKEQMVQKEINEKTILSLMSDENVLDYVAYRYDFYDSASSNIEKYPQVVKKEYMDNLKNSGHFDSFINYTSRSKNRLEIETGDGRSLTPTFDAMWKRFSKLVEDNREENNRDTFIIERVGEEPFVVKRGDEVLAFISKNNFKKTVVESISHAKKEINGYHYGSIYPLNYKDSKLNETTKETKKNVQVKAITGNDGVTFTENGTKIEFAYLIVEAKDLIVSNDANGKVNPDYPSELQPRDRSREASRTQIQNIAQKLNPELLGESAKVSDGAPIIGPDMIVESGNGRTLAIQKMYDEGYDTSLDYGEFLTENAEKLGFNKAQLETFKKPMLVRIRTSEVDRTNFVREANVSNVAAMSSTEQAMVDAAQMDDKLMALFSPTENGDLNTASNMAFLARFMGEVIAKSERGRYVQKNGNYSQDMFLRVRNAVFSKAYENAEAISILSESTDNNVRNVVNAMLMSASNFSVMKDAIAQGDRYNTDITPDIVSAMTQLSHLRKDGKSVQTFLDELTFFDEMSAEAKEMLRIFDHKVFKRSPKKLSQLFNGYVEANRAAGHPGQVQMFEKSPPTKAEFIALAMKGVKADEVQLSLLETESQDSNETGRTNEKTTNKHEEGYAGPKSNKKRKKVKADTDEVVTRTQIIEFIQDYFDVTVGNGQTNGRRGFYKNKFAIMRTKDYGDFEVIAHELGHHIDTLLGFSENPVFKEELIKFAERNLELAESMPKSKRAKEGVAEYFRQLFYNETQAHQTISELSDELRNEISDKIEKANWTEATQELMRLTESWMNRDGDHELTGILSPAGEKRKVSRSIKSYVDEIYTQFWNEDHPIWAAIKAIEKETNKKVPHNKNAYSLAVLSRGALARAATFIKGKTFNKYGETTGESFQNILKEVDDINSFDKYLLAKHALHLKTESGKDKTPITPELIEEYLAEAKPEYEALAQRVYDYQRRTLNVLVDGGLIEPDLPDKLEEKYPFYVPFQRVMTETGGRYGGKEDGGSRSNGEQYVNTQQGIKGMKEHGSSRNIISPIESIIKNTHLYFALADNNSVGRALAELAKPESEFASQVTREIIEQVPNSFKVTDVALKQLEKTLINAGLDEDMIEDMDMDKITKIFSPLFKPNSSKNEVLVWEDGKPKLYKVRDDLLYNSLVAQDNRQMNDLMRYALMPAKEFNKLLRTGITISPLFTIRTFYRSFLQLAIKTEARGFNYIKQPWEVIKAWGSVTGRTDAMYNWWASGGGQSTFIATESQYLQRNMEEVILNAKAKNMMKGWLKGQGAASKKERNMLNAHMVKTALKSPFRALNAFNDILDQSLKLAEYNVVLKQTGGDRMESALASREADLDFKRFGSAGMKFMNTYWLFFNVALQGPDNLARYAAKNKVRFMMRGLTLLTIPTLLLYMKNRDDEEYQELATHEKDMYWNFKKANGGFWKIQIPFEAGILFKTIPEKLLGEWLDYRRKEDKQSWDDFGKNTVKTLLINPFPTILDIYAEYKSGKDSQTGRPTVPAYLEGKPLEEQFDENTSEVAKGIGKAFNRSPIKIENAFIGTFGQMGQYYLYLSDLLLDSTGLADRPDTKGLKRNYLQRQLSHSINDGTTHSVDKFYDRYQELKEQHKSTGVSNAPDAELKFFNKANDYLHDLRQVRDGLLYDRFVQSDGTPYPKDEKKRIIDLTNKAIRDISRYSIGKEPLDEEALVEALSLADEYSKSESARKRKETKEEKKRQKRERQQ